MMSYKEKLIDILEVGINYLSTILLFVILLFIVIVNILIIFFGRADLKDMAKSASLYFLGGMLGRAMSR